MTDKDTDPAGAADPGGVDVCAETPAGVAGDTGAVLGELAGRLGRVEEQLAEFHRRSAHRELVIDRLHEENQQLRGGIRQDHPGARGRRPHPAG